MLKKTLQTAPSPRFPQARPLQGAGWEGTCCVSARRKQEWHWLAGRRNLRNGQKLWLMHPSKENVILWPSSLPGLAVQLRTKDLPLGEAGFFFSFNGIFSPWLFDLMNSPQLKHLWHCSGCWLCPTCSTFYLVRLLTVWSEGCTCTMKENLGVWHVRAGPWTPHGHSVLSDWHQGQPSCPSPSSKPPFPQQICWFLTFPSMRKHPPPRPVAKPLLYPWDFLFYLLSLITLGSVSQLSFLIKTELLQWSTMLEERGGWSGKRHQGAEFEILTLMVSTRAQKDRKLLIWRGAIKFPWLCSLRKLAAEKEEKCRSPF